MKIKKIFIENMHGITTSLSFEPGFNYLFGKNGAGKSTVLQAIQLALLGYIPGYNKRVGDIFKHASGDIMTVRLDFDDGTVIQRRYVQTSKNIDVQVVTVPEGLDIEHLINQIELPVFNFSSLIGMTANQLKAWFIDLLPKGYNTIDWSAELNKVIPDGVSDYEEVTKDVLNYITTIEDAENNLPIINSYIKQLISNKKAEITRLTSTLQTLVHFDELEINRPADVIQAEYESIRNKRQQLETYLNNKKRIDQINSKLQMACADVIEHGYDESKLYVEKIQKMLEDKKFVASEAFNRLNKLKFEHNSKFEQLSKIKDAAGVCPITNEVCSKIEFDSAMVTDLERDFNTIKSEMVAVKSDYDKVCAECEDYNTIIYNWSDQIFTYETLTSELQRYDVTEFNGDQNVDNYIEKEKALMDELKKSTANAQYDVMYEQLTAEQAVCETSLEILKRFDKLTGANGISTKIMSESFNTFGHKIEEYLSVIWNDTKVEFVLTEAANSFSFGINRDGTYVSYDMLSSGEKCIFALSLIFAILDVINPEIKLVTADDIFDHLDDENIDKLFKYVYTNKDVQTIFAGIHSYNKKYSNAVIDI